MIVNNFQVLDYDLINLLSLTILVSIHIVFNSIFKSENYTRMS